MSKYWMNNGQKKKSKNSFINIKNLFEFHSSKTSVSQILFRDRRKNIPSKLKKKCILLMNKIFWSIPNLIKKGVEWDKIQKYRIESEAKAKIQIYRGTSVEALAWNICHIDYWLFDQLNPFKFNQIYSSFKYTQYKHKVATKSTISHHVIEKSSCTNCRVIRSIY